MSPEAAISSNRLNGSKPPHHVLESERFWHNAAALMFAAGAVTAKEVAEAFGVSIPTVHNLIRQQWFQEKVTKLMADNGGRDIMSLFKAEGFNSLVTLIQIRDNEKAGSAVRRACAVDILDRSLGKPVQRIEDTRGPVSADPVAEVKQLEEANDRLRNAPV